jgi:hypothetical protein
VIGVKVLLSWHRPKAEFRYPSEPVPRTAVLEPWFASGSGPQVRVFRADPLADRLIADSLITDSLIDELERFAPQAIATSWPRINQLARCVSERPNIAPTHAIVVLHRGVVHRSPGPDVIRFDPLGAVDRERLWRVFRVPIFEQVIGPRGVCLATECAAHHGLHIESPGFQTGRDVDSSPCGCGQNTPRLLPPQLVEPVREPAAYAG